jgi:hypothetical protein
LAVPALHCVHEGEPGTEYVPAGHTRHTTAAAPLYVPASHVAHDDDPGALHLPAGHSMHALIDVLPRNAL